MCCVVFKPRRHLRMETLGSFSNNPSPRDKVMSNVKCQMSNVKCEMQIIIKCNFIKSNSNQQCFDIRALENPKKSLNGARRKSELSISKSIPQYIERIISWCWYVGSKAGSKEGDGGERGDIDWKELCGRVSTKYQVPSTAFFVFVCTCYSHHTHTHRLEKLLKCFKYPLKGCEYIPPAKVGILVTDSLKLSILNAYLLFDWSYLTSLSRYMSSRYIFYEMILCWYECNVPVVDEQ